MSEFIDKFLGRTKVIWLPFYALYILLHNLFEEEQK